MFKNNVYYVRIIERALAASKADQQHRIYVRIK